MDCYLDSEHSEFQVNIFSNNRDYKMSKFLYDKDNDAAGQLRRKGYISPSNTFSLYVSIQTYLNHVDICIFMYY